MKDDPVIKYGEWHSIELCKSCGIIVHDKYQLGKVPCCNNCGATSNYVLDVYSTTRRYCYTYIPPWYKFWERKKGYYEWSGKHADGGSVPSGLMSGRRISNQTITIAAAGLASGLF